MKTVAILLSVSVAATAVAETWFVDSVHGDDSAVGTSEAAAVRSLERANKLAVKPGDTVLIAGKGHENYQILGTEKIHYDEREIVKQILDDGANFKK